MRHLSEYQAGAAFFLLLQTEKPCRLRQGFTNSIGSAAFLHEKTYARYWALASGGTRLLPVAHTMCTACSTWSESWLFSRKEAIGRTEPTAEIPSKPAQALGSRKIPSRLQRYFR